MRDLEDKTGGSSRSAMSVPHVYRKLSTSRTACSAAFSLSPVYLKKSTNVKRKSNGIRHVSLFILLNEVTNCNV